VPRSPPLPPPTESDPPLGPDAINNRLQGLLIMYQLIVPTLINAFTPVSIVPLPSEARRQRIMLR
jgi:hypothetical protein